MFQFAHALSIGGTGMLARATADLALRSRALTVLARNPARLGLRAPSVHPVTCDYRDTAALTNALDGACARTGAVDIALTWIHRR